MKKIFLIALFFTIPFSIFSAKADYEKRMKLSQPAEYYKVMGDRYRILGDYVQAIKNYEYSVFKNPQWGECYYYLGYIKYKKGLYQDAVNELENSLKENFIYYFDKIKSAYLLVIIYFKMKKDGQALELLDTLIKEYENFVQRSYQAKLIKPYYYAPAFFILGLYYRNNYLLDEKKLDLFHQAILLNYKKDYANYFIGEYYQSISRLDQAMLKFEQARIVNSSIEKEVEEADWISTYDLFEEIDEQ
ncbi:MAG: hypothetical protein A2Y41_01355 [Spirochaetes bacterium GWB1_36_13]|nr:MAG: hypothetical protein A2Y41_01355 [Spirochaetes bacterium GWB1_36_13]